MAIHLLNLVPKHERRLRLLFDNQPAAAAFGTSPTTLAFYTVTPQDNLLSAETVTQAIAVAAGPNLVELALGADLAGGGLYLLSVAGMPCVDASTCTGSQLFRFGTTSARPNIEIPQDDYASLIYGIDVVHNGIDFVETSDGDLASLSGLSNAQQAVRRAAFADPLPWAPDYGAQPRQYVDGTPGAVVGLKAKLVQKLLRDDRVKTVQPTLVFDPTDVWSAYYDVNVTLIGGEVVQVPNVNVIT